MRPKWLGNGNHVNLIPSKQELKAKSEYLNHFSPVEALRGFQVMIWLSNKAN